MKKVSKAHKKACDLENEGKFEEASFYFMNSLSNDPGNIDIILDYTNNIIKLAKDKESKGLINDAIKEFSWLEAFLKDRVIYVDYEKIEKILDILEQIDNEKNKIFLNETQSKITDKEKEFIDFIKSTSVEEKNGKITLPNAENLEEKIKFMEELCKYLEDTTKEFEPKNIEYIYNYNEKLRLASQYEKILEETRQLMEYARTQDISSAAYCLQMCEDFIKQLIIMKRDLDENRQKKVLDLLHELQKLSDDIMKKKRKEDSLKSWKRYETKFLFKMGKVYKLMEPLYDTPDKFYQKNIDDINCAMSCLQEEMPNFLDEEIQKKAINEFSKHREELTKKTELQYKRYNKWAIRMIQEGYKKGISFVGNIYNDHSDIGNTIVDYFGAIDTRYLNSEIQRCYSEVFEYLFKNLKGPWNKDDLEASGYKLNVLDRMAKVSKRQIPDF